MGTKRRAILFDIDGTLIVSGGAGATSWRRAFDELYGIPADIGEFSDIGLTDPEVATKTFAGVLNREPSPDEYQKLLACRLKHLHDAVAESEGYRVLPGVETTLPRLIADGYVLGLVTGNTEAAGHIKLHRAGLNRYFAFGGFGSDSADRGELTKVALRRGSLVYGATLAPADFIAVGDTPHDAEAAHAAGIACIGVASHKFSVSDLKAGGCDVVIESLEEGLPL